MPSERVTTPSAAAGTATASWSGQRVLVTGGLGFLGSNLAIRLVAAGADVTLVDAMLPEYGGNFHNLEPIRDRVRIQLTDVRDEHVMALLLEGVDTVFHLAAQVSHVKSLSDPYADIDINIKGTVAVMEAVRKTCPKAVVVRSGTRGEYGPSAKLPVSEDAPTQPRGMYEISLLANEKIMLMYHQAHGVPTVHLRLTNTYGPRAQMKSPHYGVANWLVRRALDDGRVTLMGDGLQKRDFLYVDDAVEAMLRAATVPACRGEVINIGDDHPSTFRELADCICRAVPGARIEHIDWTPERKALEPGDFYSDITKAGRLLAWRPQVALADGIARTVEFYREHRAHYW